MTEEGTSGGRTARDILASSRAGVALALLVTIGSVSRTAVAADPEPARRLVQVEQGVCESLPARGVAAILRVELLNRVVEGPARADTYRTAIECAGSLVSISVGVPGGATRAMQTNLGGVPVNVRARIVALAIAEIVHGLDEEPPHLAPTPRPAPVVPVVAVENREVATPAPVLGPRPVELEAFAQTSSFQLAGGWLVGGGLRVDYRYRRLSVGLDAVVLRKSDRFAVGSADVLLGYGSPTIAWEEGWGRVQTRLGAGYAVGEARLSGHATDGRALQGTVTGGWSAPYGLAGIALVLTDAFVVEARGQIGWVATPVIGDVAGGESVALKGVWASVGVGVALAL